jgi:hypothetical protein
MTVEYAKQDSFGGKERKTIVEVPGGPDDDYVYVVFPLKAGAPPPACARLADGVLKIVTAESEDTVFLGDTPFAWDKDGVIFTGRAGAVRVFKDRVALCLNAGGGDVGYQGCVRQGHGPSSRGRQRTRYGRVSRRSGAGTKRRRRAWIWGAA